MELQGKIIKVFQEKSGEGKKGLWRKQDYILETPGDYPKKVCFCMWGDLIDQSSLSVGDQITASIEIESREYNEKWYTDIKVWKVSVDSHAPVKTEVPRSTSEENQDNLPF